MHSTGLDGIKGGFLLQSCPIELSQSKPFLMTAISSPEDSGQGKMLIVSSPPISETEIDAGTDYASSSVVFPDKAVTCQIVFWSSSDSQQLQLVIELTWELEISFSRW